MKITIEIPDKLIATTVRENTAKLEAAVTAGIEDAFDTIAVQVRSKTKETFRARIWSAFIDALKASE